MRKIKEVLRLHLGAGLSRRQVSAATGLPYTTIADHLARAARAGISWPLPEELDDAALEARLYRATQPGPRPVARELHRSLEAREMSAADLLQSLDDLGWSHDPKHLREVLGGKVLPSLAYLSEIMAALARRGQALRPSELSYWTGAMYEENEVIALHGRWRADGKCAN